MKIKDCDGFIKFALGENVKQSNWGDFNTIRFPQTRMGVEQVFYDAFYRAKKYKNEWLEYNKLSLRKKENKSSKRRYRAKCVSRNTRWEKTYYLPLICRIRN